MRKRKDYTLQSGSTNNEPIDGPCPWVWQFGTQKIDFRRWKHKGGNQDNLLVNRGELLDQLRDAMWQLRHELTEASLIALYHSGISEFLRFIDDSHLQIYSIKDITQDSLINFVLWVKRQKPKGSNTAISYATARRKYSSLKTLLSFYTRNGCFDKRFFPVNPFPNSNKRQQGAQPYTKTEMTRIMRALYYELNAIRNNKCSLSSRSQLAVYIHLIVAKTGINKTPLEEATRDCLQAHPLHPNKAEVLITYKRRGMNSQAMSIRSQNELESLKSLPISVADLIREAIKMTEPLLKNAKFEDKNKIWLYRPSHEEDIKSFKSVTLNKASRSLTLKHKLLDDNDKPLNISSMRLRKTFAERIWHLTNGDIWKTARILGNTPTVTDRHYLDVTPIMERNHSFVGKALELNVRGLENEHSAVTDFSENAGLTIEQAKSVLSGSNNTGVARCSSPMHGKYAPDNGEPCGRFLDCFRCPNQIVLEEDLYRLYSFYWLLLKERPSLGRKRWKKWYGWVIREIDNGIASQFDTDTVEEAKQQALSEPHPMWANRIILGKVDE